METNYLTETKVSKSNNGKGKSFTYSTVIPKVIVTKFGLDKGKKLCWDIDDGKIIITPELPEAKSIEAGIEILKDFLFSNNTVYAGLCTNILVELQTDKNPDDKAKELVRRYKATDEKDSYKKLVLYLLDYPETPENHEILQRVYDEITKD